MSIWPSPGADFPPELDLPNCQMIIRKGFHSDVDSYSGFREADRKTMTGLAGYMAERGFSRLFVVGLATDFCVSWTAEDAAGNGYETYVIEDLTRPTAANGSLEAAHARMGEAGVRLITAADVH